jgi:AraC family transcriptional regulator
MGIDFAFVSQDLNGSADCSFLQPDHILMVYLNGQVRAKEYELESAPSKRVEQPRPGSVWVLPAEHRGSALARGHAVANYCQLTVSAAALGSRALRPAVGPDPLLHQLVTRISHVRHREDVTARLLQESLTETVRLHIGDRYGPQAAMPAVDSPTVLGETTQALLREYLADSFDAKINLQTLAHMAGMSINTFIKAFADAFHTTPHQYLLNQRISRAKTLLSTTTMTMTEISAAVGFSTPSHFTTTFGNRVGVTPSQYRRHT